MHRAGGDSAFTAPRVQLDLVLRLRVSGCLPLHVRRIVGTAALERGHMVDDVATA